MSSPPGDLSLEGLIADNWDEVAARDPRVVALLEPYRESVEYVAGDFDEETQSWRDYRGAVWSTVPEEVMQRVSELMRGAQPVTAPETSPHDAVQVVATTRWRETPVTANLHVRVRLTTHHAQAEFEIVGVQSRGDAVPVLIAYGTVDFDGHMCARLERTDGAAHHWYTQRDVEAFGSALLKAREIAADMIPSWDGDL